MKHQLIPPPQLAPPSVKRFSAAEKIAAWAEMVDEGDQLILANLRRRLGPEADLTAAFLEWLDRRNAERYRSRARRRNAFRRKGSADGE
jgi:hypothetical protein